MAETVLFQRPDGRECSGYYVRSGGGNTAPGVVVIQEWWGLNDQIQGVADRMAEAGFQALVPDLYRGKVTVEAAEAEHWMAALDFGDAATQDVRGAVQHLKSRCKKVGVVGFCMGGALAILTVIHVKEADAAVSWYGVPPEGSGDPSSIGVPLQGHFAVDDEFFSPDQVDALEAKLRKGRVLYEFYRYQAKHAFGNETVVNYDPEARRLAWQRTIDFLGRNLK